MGVSVHSLGLLSRLAGIAGKELELHNRPIAFSVSHEPRTQRLTGWGPVVDRAFYTVQSFPIYFFDSTVFKGRTCGQPINSQLGFIDMVLPFLMN